MHERGDADGWRALRALRALEGRVRHLRAEWKAFREAPAPAGLADLRRAVRGLEEALGAAETALGAAAGSGDEGGRGFATRRPAPGEGEPADARDRGGRPGAREVIRANRRLDRLIGELLADWKGFEARPGPDSLAPLLERLRAAHQASAVLLRALLPTAEHEGVHVARSAGESAPTRSADEGGRLARTLEARLWRIQGDWHHLRLRPEVHHLRLLRDELAEARAAARALGELLDAGEEPPLRAAPQFRVGLEAWRDAFTGIYNREGFRGLAEAELKRCRRYDRPFGLLLLRLTASELAELRSALHLLQEALRGYDLVARLEDGCIAVGLPEADGGHVRRVAGRLLRELGRGDGRPVDALGYATLPEDGLTLSRLESAARRRMGDRSRPAPPPRAER